jgi:hypothetical protein
MDEVAAYEGSGLPERQKVALSLTDAYSPTQPASPLAGTSTLCDTSRLLRSSSSC